MARQGILVEPYQRLNDKQIAQVHRLSMEILADPGIICFNRTATEFFADAGAEVITVKGERLPYWILKIPEKLIMEAIEAAPKVVKLGARNKDNSLILDGYEPRVRFASGSETNNWLEVDIEAFISKNEPGKEVNFPVFRMQKGNTDRLATAAHLCEHLDSWDSFLRPVNIQDDAINDDNKDVNKFFVSLKNTTKHVMAGLTQLNQLDNVIRMAQLIAGGEDEFRDNPIISFITSLIKSPLQLVDDTTQKTIEIAKRGVPVVISSAPQGGSTAPILEAGIVAQVNAEILTGISLAQLVNKGTPVLYGSVPGRANMNNLNDSYGVPEFSQYNVDCVQMARHYGLPCYSSGGISDARVPGIQASVERLFSHTLITLAGPQYMHYAFGLMERTATFCPVQAVLDDAHIGMIKGLVRQPVFTDSTISEVLEQTRRVMNSSTKLFTRFVRSALRSGEIAPPYQFESGDMADETLFRAQERLDEILSLPPNHIEKEIVEEVFQQIPGLLKKLRNS
ncbi:trimethylamine methyltransferase family protein [Chloroflexota bacterium]